jgi:hypothetical protein
LHQPSLDIKIENSKGEKFMKSITLDNFFHYTVVWDHPFGQDHCPTGTSKSSGVRHSKCHLMEQMSQITIVAARLALPHNLAKICDVPGCTVHQCVASDMACNCACDLSITCHYAQGSKSNTLKPRTSCTRKIIHPTVTSKVIGTVCCK